MLNPKNKSEKKKEKEKNKFSFSILGFSLFAWLFSLSFPKDLIFDLMLVPEINEMPIPCPKASSLESSRH